MPHRNLFYVEQQIPARPGDVGITRWKPVNYFEKIDEAMELEDRLTEEAPDLKTQIRHVKVPVGR